MTDSAPVLAHVAIVHPVAQVTASDRQHASFGTRWYITSLKGDPIQMMICMAPEARHRYLLGVSIVPDLHVEDAMAR